MVSLAGHLQSIESEKQKLRSQVRRLCQENAWLRDELADTQQRLQQSEQRCVTLDEERTHLQFMNDMRKYDSESSHQVAHFSSSSSLSSSSFLDLFIGTTVEAVVSLSSLQTFRHQLRLVFFSYRIHISECLSGIVTVVLVVTLLFWPCQMFKSC